MSGKKSLECKCDEPIERERYRHILEINANPDFDQNRADEAQRSLHEFLRSGRILHSDIEYFTENEVRVAFKRLNQSATGIDVLSKKSGLRPYLRLG